jgi:hypothetical protein
LLALSGLAQSAYPIVVRRSPATAKALVLDLEAREEQQKPQPKQARNLDGVSFETQPNT